MGVWSCTSRGTDSTTSWGLGMSLVWFGGSSSGWKSSVKKMRKKKHKGPLPKKFDTRVTTVMKKVLNPECGNFYAIGPRSEIDGTVNIYTEKEYPTTWDGYPATTRKLMGEVTPGEIVYYIGPVKYRYQKIGYQDYFGLVETDSVVFYDLGDLDAL
jgi:hypothetical protein